MSGNRFPNLDDRALFGRAAKKSTAIPRDLTGKPIAARLSTTSVTATLTANATQTTPTIPGATGAGDYVEFLRAEAQVSWGRIINCWSRQNRAFDARIGWTSGGGGAGELFVTAGGGGLQVFVHAKTVSVDLANWLDVAQNITVSIEDGYGQSQELHRVERALALAAGASRDFNIPSYAREVRVTADEAAQTANILVSQIDDGPAIMAQFLAVDGFVPVGAASRIRVTNNDAAVLDSYVLDYQLGYQ